MQLLPVEWGLPIGAVTIIPPPSSFLLEILHATRNTPRASNA